MHKISLEKYNLRTDLIIEREDIQGTKKETIKDEIYQVERIEDHNDKYVSISFDHITDKDNFKTIENTLYKLFVVMKKDKVDNYKDAEYVKDLKFAVEAGSAGKKEAEANGFTFTEVKDQATALTEVMAGTSDAAIIDSLMAAAMVGEGTGYDELTYTVPLNSEEYGVGFRKGSDLVEKLNQFFKDSYADGTMMATAEEYGVQASIIEQ